ncbi:esterase/lipase family protein [Corynebacterium aquilae]|uniref:esterase/lipase family protein n=1 Tax=Corynebacterium aquilae TaxID=203263 RepID=UPI000A03D696|nr:alpha/beta fold hydrolase [Corynebacterium aquilae]
MMKLPAGGADRRRAGKRVCGWSLPPVGVRSAVRPVLVALVVLVVLVAAVGMVVAPLPAQATVRDELGAEGQARPVRAVGVDGPEAHNLAEAKWLRMRSPEPVLKPRGTNDPNCRVDAAHPRAIVLLHGTDSTFYEDYSLLGPVLVDRGWCVFGLDYGLGPKKGDGFGWQPMEQSAAQVDELVGAAMASSKAQQVDVIGFSQGASVARAWMKWHARPGQVHGFIGLASPTRGGSFYGLAPMVDVLPAWLRQAFVSPALLELVAGSAFVEGLNAGGELPEGVVGYTIGTRFDEMMPEGKNQELLSRPGSHVWIQDVCPGNLGGHMFLPYNPTAIDVVVALLEGKTAEQLGSVGVGVACPRVPLGAWMGDISVADNLRKLGFYPTKRDAVSYTLG